MENDLSFLFEGLPTKNDKNNPVSTASSEDLEALLSYAENQKLEENRKATYADVIKSGGIRAGAGPIQTISAIMESSGLLEKGTTKEFTLKVLEAEKMGDMDLAQSIVRDTVSNIVPIAAEVALTRGVPFKEALGKTAVIGGAGGFFSFVENPDQAAPLSMVRMGNTALGSFFGPLLMAGGLAAGKVVSTLSGSRGPVSVSNADIAPNLPLRQEGAETIEQAAEKGITLTPGAATNDVALLNDEIQRGVAFSPQVQRFLSDTMQTNAKNMQELIDDLVNTVIPEGKDNITAVVNNLYEQASTETLNSAVFSSFRNNETIQSIISGIMKNPSSKAAYESYPASSVGRLNFILKELQTKIDSVEGTDTAAYLINLKKQLQNTLKAESPSYARAVETSQRDKTAREVLDALTRTGSKEIIPTTNYADNFVSAFSNPKVKEQMAFGIRSISDPTQRQNALEKMEFILKILPKLSEQERVIEKIISSNSDILARRGSPFSAALYTLENVLKSNNDEKFIRFIFNPEKSASRLRELSPKRYTGSEESLKQMGFILSEILGEGFESSFLSVPYRLDDKQAFNSSSDKVKTNALIRLQKSGRLEEFMVKNPEAYEELKRAERKIAIV